MASGKTTICDHLIANYGYTQIKLARPIYDVVNNIDKYTPIILYKKFLEPYIIPALTEDKIIIFLNGITHIKTIPNEKPKPRKRLQQFGTECGRQQIRDTVWIDILLEKIKRDNKKHLFVIDDVRFPNELKAMRQAAFYCIKLDVTPSIQRKRILSLYGKIDEKIFSHPSEIEILNLKGDITVDASQLLESMLKDVDRIFKGG